MFAGLEPEFIGRAEELKSFNEAYESDEAQLIAVYGRRRVGKTEFLWQFCKDKPCIFFPCDTQTDDIQLENFSKALIGFSDEYSWMEPFRDWASAFSFMGRIKTDRRLVVVIDEFPFMVDRNNAIPGILKRIWDTELFRTKVMLILCGSSVSFMVDEILGAEKPLYGRFSFTYPMSQLPYADAVKFFTNYSNEDKLIAYSITGGVPFYLEKFKQTRTVEENVEKLMLVPNGALRYEIELLMNTEFRDPATYISIIKSIAVGNCSQSKLCGATGLDGGVLNVYIKKLIKLGFVKDEYSFSATEKERSKPSRAHYILTDNFFKFWYSFVNPNADSILKWRPVSIWNNSIKNHLHDYASKTFGEVCIDYMRTLNINNRLPFAFSRIGREWWDENVRQPDGSIKPVTKEVDMIAADDTGTKFIYGECKFKNEKFGMDELNNLRSKVKNNGEIYYYLFSLRGFTEDVMSEASSHTVLLTLDDVFNPPSDD
ncbi:MAG: ATP-binding protein [Clostridiales bacterium]|nr:ATP-binding protein [Clostridiales bacterium]